MFIYECVLYSVILAGRSRCGQQKKKQDLFFIYFGRKKNSIDVLSFRDAPSLFLVRDLYAATRFFRWTLRLRGHWRYGNAVRKTGAVSPASLAMGSTSLRQRSFHERFRKCLRISLTFLFSQVGLIALVVAYSAAGAVLFEWLEADQEIEPRRKILSIRLDCLHRLRHLTRIDSKSSFRLFLYYDAI